MYHEIKKVGQKGLTYALEKSQSKGWIGWQWEKRSEKITSPWRPTGTGEEDKQEDKDT